MPKLNSASLPEPLYMLCRQINNAGGHAWLVGGCVRDMILGIQPGDFDLEVYHLQPDVLHGILKQSGHTQRVGRQFGVFKLWMDRLEIDVAMPRSELKSGDGHCAFEVSIDPDLPPEIACLRRDFTINAMMFDPLNGRFIDFHNGIKDLKNNILRHVSNAFLEDPLRPLRAMQFAARFHLQLHQCTADLCAMMLTEASSLSLERIWSEWRKWSHAPFPSYGLRALSESGWLALYPALQSLSACPQSPYWHPEGDVWAHTLQVCDQAALIAKRNHLDDSHTGHLVFSALCHDFGKPACTVINDPQRIHSPGHTEAGIVPAKHFMRSIGAPKHMNDYIFPLIRNHITHLHDQPTPRAVRRLAHRLEPTNITLWEMLVEADASGRHPAPPSRPALPWLQQAIDMGHHQSAPQAIVSGKLLLQLEIALPGPGMGKIIKQAYSAQLESVFDNTQTATAWLKYTYSDPDSNQ